MGFELGPGLVRDRVTVNSHSPLTHCTCTHTHTHSHKLTLPPSLPHTLTHTLTHSIPHTLTHTLSLPPTHTHTQHSHTIILIQYSQTVMEKSRLDSHTVKTRLTHSQD